MLIAILRNKDGFEKRMAIAGITQTIYTEKAADIIGRWCINNPTPHLRFSRTEFQYHSADWNKGEVLYLEAPNYSPTFKPMSNVYSFDKLKGVLRRGDIVRLAPGKRNDCSKLGTGKDCTITDVQQKQFSIDGCAHSFDESYCFLQIIKRNGKLSKENIQVGDSIVDEDDDAYGTVMAVCDGLVGLSEAYDPTDFNGWEGIDKLIERDCKLKLPALTPAKPDEVTMADVIKQFGREVVIKKE